MTTRGKTLSFILSLAAAASVAILLAWLFSLEGTKGLSAWGWSKVFIGFAALGLLPLVLSLGGLPKFRDASSRLAALLSLAAASFAVIAMMASAGVAGYIESKARAVARPVPAVSLVDPAKGISARDPGGADGPVLHLAISSDPHWGADTANATARLSILGAVAAEKPPRDAFFILGDNTQMGFNDAEWAAEARDLVASLGTVPVRPLLGNHDAIVDGQYHYREYFFPKPLSSDTGSPYYYSIDAGPALVVVLDLLWGAEDFDAKRAAWLEKTLAAAPAEKRIIVLTHCFLASSGYMDGDQPWFDHAGTLASVAPILERHKVDLVLQGHNHYMEFLVKDGVAYATVGAMGGKPDPEPTHVSPWSKWFLRGSYGWADVDVSRAGTRLSFRDASGTELHSEFIKATR